MTLDEFNRLGRRDFENGAVLDEIAAVFKNRDSLQAVANDLADWPSVINRVHAALRRVPAQLASSALDPNDKYRFPALSLRLWIRRALSSSFSFKCLVKDHLRSRSKPFLVSLDVSGVGDARRSLVWLSKEGFTSSHRTNRLK